MRFAPLTELALAYVQSEYPTAEVAILLFDSSKSAAAKCSLSLTSHFSKTSAVAVLGNDLCSKLRPYPTSGT